MEEAELQCWETLITDLRHVCSPVVILELLGEAGELWITYVNQFKELHGEVAITINFHMTEH